MTGNVREKNLFLLFKVYYHPLLKAFFLLSKVNSAMLCVVVGTLLRTPRQRDQYGRAMQPCGIFWTQRRRTTSRRQESQKPLRED